ncbi:MAG: DUF4188 domain-containing protein [Acidobacteriaceae bacterium]|jgi:hypothetical protein
MSKVFPGRYAAQIEGPFVVFLIGMRINRLFAIHKWLPVARSMPPMLQEVAANKDSGFLHAEIALTWRGVATIQYWRSFEALHAYAHDRDAKHMPAWAAFNRAVGNNGSVGVWHETFQVAPGRYECVYVNMPRWGLAAAAEHASAIGRLNNAKSRMAARNSAP